jgi:hypothetical protein
MPNSGFPLDAYVIFDNNAIVGICEFCCSTYKDKPFYEAVTVACHDIEKILNAIRRFSIQNKVYTTPCILEEFKPENGELANHRGFQNCHCDLLKTHIRNQFECLDINMKSIDQIRQMAHTPRRFGENLSGLSDQDLSLFILALGIAGKLNERVYILSDEEKLRGFTSWSKTRPEIRKVCVHPEKVEALHSMVYLDSVHRHCAITTDQIYKMFGYRSLQQMTRTMLAGTTMGEMVTETYGGIYQMINESSIIKREIAGVVV